MSVLFYVVLILFMYNIFSLMSFFLLMNFFLYRENLIVVDQGLHLVVIIVTNMNTKVEEVMVEVMETAKGKLTEEEDPMKEIVILKAGVGEMISDIAIVITTVETAMIPG